MLHKMSLLAASLLVLSAPALADVPADVQPTGSEVQVEGKIALVIPNESRLVVSVSKVLTTAGGETFLDPPRLKTIQLRSITRWHTSEVTGEKPALEGLYPGATVAAVGVNLGQGNALPARSLWVDMATVREARSAQARASLAEAKLVLPRTSSRSWWDIWLPKSGGAEVIGERDGNALKVTVTEPGRIEPDIQLAQGSVSIQNGKRYTVRFRARAEAKRPLRVLAQNGGGSTSRIGLEERLEVGPAWKQYEVTFTATGVGNESEAIVPMFFFGGTKGAVWFSDIEVIEGKPEEKEPAEGAPEAAPKAEGAKDPTPAKAPPAR